MGTNHKPIKTHEQFLKDLDRVHPDRDWEVIGTYVHNKTPILLRDEYGDCLIPPVNILQKSKPSVKTAVNKTEYTINKFKEVWGDRYDYSKFEYKGARVKSIIVCRVHGKFIQDANMHLSGCGCLKCANESISSRVRSNTEEFIKKAQEKYGVEKYTYECSDYDTATTNIKINCPTHGIFEQTPNRFLNGQICPKCKYKEGDTHRCYHNLKKERNNSILYIIRCYDENESFLKIGVTSRSIKARFSCSDDLPYNFEVLREFRYPNIEVSDGIETYLLKITKPVNYTPSKSFSGWTECRQEYIKNHLLELFDNYVDYLNYVAFTNFCIAYDGFFDVDMLSADNYTDLEKDCVMKGFKIHCEIESGVREHF